MNHGSRQTQSGPKQVINEHGMAVWHDAGAKFPGISLGHLSTKKENACRVIDPDENNHHGACGAKGGGDATRRKIVADDKFPHRKKEGRPD